MTEDELPQPPYAVDLLADLHAGSMSDELAARLWPVVRSDPGAMAVIESLDSVTRRLRALGDADTVGTQSIPPEVAARLDAALVADAAARRRRRWLLAAAGAGAAAAVAIGVAVTAQGVERPDASLPTTATAAGADPTAAGAIPTAAGAGPTASADVLDPAMWRAMIGTSDTGPLSNGTDMRECLSANGIDDSQPLLGSRTIRFEGREAVALVLGDPTSSQLTALVVGTGCRASDPDTLVIRRIG